VSFLSRWDMSVFSWPPAVVGAPGLGTGLLHNGGQNQNQNYLSSQEEPLAPVEIGPGGPAMPLFQVAGSMAASSPNVPDGAQRLIVPQRVDEVYELLDILGEGAYSSVCLGQHNESGERVAVKVIDVSQLTTPKLRWRLHNEFSINRLCTGHPNLVQLREVWESDDDACFVLDLCAGGELFERVAQRGREGFSEAEAMHVMRQLVSAVCFLHAQGIVHRE
jgi:serine/threonine protein kinase